MAGIRPVFRCNDTVRHSSAPTKIRGYRANLTSCRTASTRSRNRRSKIGGTRCRRMSGITTSSTDTTSPLCASPAKPHSASVVDELWPARLPSLARWHSVSLGEEIDVGSEGVDQDHRASRDARIVPDPGKERVAFAGRRLTCNVDDDKTVLDLIPKHGGLPAYQSTDCDCVMR